MNNRINKLRQTLIEKEIDGMIVSNPINIRYLTNITSEGLLLLKPKEIIFLTDSRYTEELEKQFKDNKEIKILNIADLNKFDYEEFFSLCNNVGFEENYITYSKYQNYMQLYQTNLIETEEVIEKLREEKEEEEIEIIKKACKITDDAFEYILKYIKPGMTEKRIAFEIEKFMRMNGAEGVAFEFCVASSKNASMPHAVPTDRHLQRGDILLLDIGAKVDGYCSDFTRTICLGKASDKFKEVYNFVLDEQKKIIQSFKPDIEISRIIEKVCDKYKEKNYKILHAFGHGVGLEIHENPSLGMKTEKFIKENMILAVEPGVYFPNEFGIRIEDTVQITKNGCIELTKSTKNLIEIEI